MDNPLIYEKHNWQNLNNAKLKEKLNLIEKLIPDSVTSIVDVGCGNGVITNYLAKKYKVVGVDRSSKALEFVSGDKVQASSDNIPLPNGSFDLVLSSELLEHLEEKVFEGTVIELKRLSKRYVLITVPNQENPNKLSIRCPSCSYIFNRPNHLRSIGVADLIKNFPDFKVVSVHTIGKKVRYYNPRLLTLKISYTPSHAWIPYFWISKDDRITICPKCSTGFSYPYKFNIFSTIVDVVNVLISPKRPYWLVVLLEKVEDVKQN